MENKIDKLFKSKLNDHQAAYDPAAWGRMAALIDEDKDLNRKPILPPNRRSKSIFVFALFFVSCALGIWLFVPTSTSEIEMKTTSLNDKEQWNELNSNKVNVLEEYSLDNQKSNISQNDGKDLKIKENERTNNLDIGRKNKNIETIDLVNEKLSSSNSNEQSTDNQQNSFSRTNDLIIPENSNTYSSIKIINLILAQM